MEYGRCQSGMEEFMNGMEDNLPYFHTNCILDLQKNTYRCRVVKNNIVTEVFNFNMYAYYLFVDELRYFDCLYYANSVGIASL